jgi:hypothetical protein
MATDATAARIAALQASPITRVDQRLMELFKHVESEIEAPKELLNAARLQRVELLDEAGLLTDLSAARRECQAAGIPFTQYDPVIREAAAVYTDLARFMTAPRPPALDQIRNTQTDEPIPLPAGSGLAHDADRDAHRRLSEVQVRMNTVINRLVEFRDASIGVSVPKACLPDGSSILPRLVQELERVVQRLRYEPRLLFEKDWDYNEGLNAGEINKLATPLGRGPIFEHEPHDDRRLLRVRNPNAAKLPTPWTVWGCGGHSVAVANDMVAALGSGAKLTDTLEHLRAWISVASTAASSSPGGQASAEKSPGTVHPTASTSLEKQSQRDASGGELSDTQQSQTSTPDGPLLKGCFRYERREVSGIGEKQWVLLKALWGQDAPRKSVGIEEAHRAVYGRKEVNRDNLRSLWNSLNETLAKLKIGYAVAPTYKGADEIRLERTSLPT